MSRHLTYFRPGEEARMLARLQFGCHESGGCGATLTYPINGFPWRRNIMKSFEFDVDAETVNLLFSEVTRIRVEHPRECLTAVSRLWNDTSEKGNGITRDRKSGTLCYSIVIARDDGGFDEQCSIREDSDAFLNSALYRVVTDLVAPHENL
jgi:hypothetical protein